MTFQQRIFSAFFLIFALFTVGVALLEQSREKEHKTVALEQRLDAYINAVNRGLNGNIDVDGIISLFPENIRLTMIDDYGAVLYDNEIKTIPGMANHADRPEIISARENGTGSDIRTSLSNNRQYLYYARKFPNCYIRAAMPYDITVRSFLEPDNLFLYYLVTLFIIVLLLMLYASGQFEKSTRKDTGRLKYELTGNITHELRTPVTGIRGCLETILDNPLDDEKKQYFIQTAYNQTLVLSELIQDMSLLTKIGDAPHSFRLESVSIYNLLSDLKKDLHSSLKEKSIKTEWNIGSNVIVHGNRNLIYAIFRNLIDNVIRYAGNNVTVKISKYNENQRFYYFMFSDNGVGIPDNRHLSRLFERFYRVNEGRTRDTGGSGLGLSIVKNAVLFHNGTIVVRNRTGGGLEFAFRLPKE
jgi:signal transduction histidine kinase